jgi:hypothetical protein
MQDWIPPGWALTQFIGTVALGTVIHRVTLILWGLLADAAGRVHK